MVVPGTFQDFSKHGQVMPMRHHPHGFRKATGVSLAFRGWFRCNRAFELLRCLTRVLCSLARLCAFGKRRFEVRIYIIDYVYG